MLSDQPSTGLDNSDVNGVLQNGSPIRPEIQEIFSIAHGMFDSGVSRGSIRLGRLLELLDDSGGIAHGYDIRRDVFHDDRPRADNRVSADSHSGQDHGIDEDPDVVLDDSLISRIDQAPARMTKDIAPPRDGDFVADYDFSAYHVDMGLGTEINVTADLDPHAPVVFHPHGG